MRCRNRRNSPCSCRGDLLWCRQFRRGGVIDISGTALGPSRGRRRACRRARPVGLRPQRPARPAARRGRGIPAQTAAADGPPVTPARRGAAAGDSAATAKRPAADRPRRADRTATAVRLARLARRLSHRRAFRCIISTIGPACCTPRRSISPSSRKRSARRSIAIRPRRSSGTTASSPAPSPTCRRSSATP